MSLKTPVSEVISFSLTGFFSGAPCSYRVMQLLFCLAFTMCVYKLAILEFNNLFMLMFVSSVNNIDTYLAEFSKTGSQQNILLCIFHFYQNWIILIQGNWLNDMSLIKISTNNSFDVGGVLSVALCRNRPIGVQDWWQLTNHRTGNWCTAHLSKHQAKVAPPPQHFASRHFDQCCHEKRILLSSLNIQSMHLPNTMTMYNPNC